MPRGLLVFALAFIVVAVPLSADVCDAVCAAHTGHSIDRSASAASDHHSSSQPSHHHHSASAPAPVTQTAILKALPHECVRLEAAVTESSDFTASHVVNDAVTTPGFTAPLAHVSAASATDSRHGPPAPTRTTSPLRI
jgi:hypothetical protein